MKSFYTGSTLQLIGNIFTSIILIIICFTLIYAQVLGNIFYLLFFIALVLSTAYLNLDFFTTRVTISEEGVQYHSLTKKFELKWKDINYVELRKVPIFRKSKDFLVFSTERFNTRDLRDLISPNEFITMENKSKGVLLEVKKYYKGVITGAEHIE